MPTRFLLISALLFGSAAVRSVVGAQELIEISKSFDVDAKIIGRVEASEGKHLSIESPYGSFSYS